MSQIQDELKSFHFASLNLFSERMLRNLHLLASGHPRTVEYLPGAINNGDVYNWVKPLLITKNPLSPYALLCQLIALNC